jgi:hypothetical protein
MLHGNNFGKVLVQVEEQVHAVFAVGTAIHSSKSRDAVRA